MNARKIRTIAVLSFAGLFAIGSVGCSDEDVSIMNEGETQALETMAESGVVTIASGEVEDDFVQSGNPMAAISASLKLVLSSSEVVDILEIQNAPQTLFLPSSKTCFDVSPGGGLSVELDFSGCAQYGLGGKIRVAKEFTGLFAGPIKITFKDGFTIQDVAITGSLGLTRIAGKRLTFKAFTADADGTPGTPLSVEYIEKQITLTTKFDGKVKLSILTGEVMFWGLASSTIEGVTSTIYVGGVSEDEVVGPVPPVDAIAYKILPFDCYCPSKGVMSGNLTLSIGEVAFDLDDFTEDNGADDYPAFAIPVDLDGSYTATVTFRECGMMKLQLNVENETPIDFSVGIDAILSALEMAYSQGLIPDDVYGEMKAIIAAAQGIAPSFHITVGDLVNTLSGALDMYYYIPFCAVAA